MDAGAFPLLVEFPRGSHGLSSPEPFPAHGGHLPRTLGPDRGPLAAFAVTAGPAAVGDRLQVRAAALLLAGPGQWVICVPAEDGEDRSPDDLPAAVRRDIERFVAVAGARWCDRDAATAAVLGGRAAWTAASAGE